MTRECVTCPECGFQGVLQPEEATLPYTEDGFKPLGGDGAANLRLRCPSCRKESTYAVTSFAGNAVRVSTLLLASAALAGAMALVRYLLFG
jgi:endogenous inhibitor of DNA gyrase (YacG/DUF329 family)